MREFTKISGQFWIGHTGREIKRLGPECQITALYLLSGPSANAIGLYYLPLPTMAHETGLTPEKSRKALQQLVDLKFCTFDEISETVFVVNMARFQIGSRLKREDKRIIWIRRELEKMHSSPFFNRFLEIYGERFQLNGMGSGDEDTAPAPPRSPDMTAAQAQLELEERRKMAQ